MKLSSVLKVARTTALRQLSEKDKTDEVIIGYINLAVEDMYKRFSFKLDEIIIALQDGKTIYSLDGTDADVTVNGNIIDPDTVLTVVEAFDENGEIGVNNDNDAYSIYTPGYDEIQVPLTANQSYISVIYKKAPVCVEYIDDGNGNAVDQNIPIPIGLRDALIKYIKWIAFESVDDLPTEQKRESDYEKACAKARKDGVVPQDSWNRPISVKGFNT